MFAWGGGGSRGRNRTEPGTFRRRRELLTHGNPHGLCRTTSANGGGTSQWPRATGALRGGDLEPNSQGQATVSLTAASRNETMESRLPLVIVKPAACVWVRRRMRQSPRRGWVSSVLRRVGVGGGGIMVMVGAACAFQHRQEQTPAVALDAFPAARTEEITELRVPRAQLFGLMLIFKVGGGS